jgi:protocatechuate 3,4-dioxygenase beta subunit
MSEPRAVAFIGFALVCATLSLSASPAQMRPPATASGRGAIVGRVVDTSGAPVPRASVSLSRDETWGPDPSRPLQLEVVTDEDGEFAFASLPAGHFRTRASKAGYQDGLEPQSVTLASDTEKKLDLIVKLPKLASVTGIVTDEAGDPVEGVSVGAYRKTIVSGRPVYEGVRGGTTNDRGEYRIRDLEPAEYVMVLNPGSFRVRLATGDATAPRVESFSYPRVIAPEPSRDGTLAPVTLTFGKDLAGIDFHLTLTRTSRVSGRVELPPDVPTDSVRGRLRPVESSVPAPLRASLTSTFSVQPNGSFRIDNVSPGQYILDIFPQSVGDPRPMGAGETVIQTPTGTITSWVNLTDNPRWPAEPLPGAPAMWASVAITVGAADASEMQISLEPGPMVTGRLVFDGPLPHPTDENLRASRAVNIESAEGTSLWISNPRVVIGTDHRFGVKDLTPGRYVFKKNLGGWRLRTITVNGRDATNIPVDFRAGEKADVVIVFSNRETFIQGVVTGYKPGETLRIACFPADPRQWVDYGRWSEQITLRNAGTDGHFSLYIPPGDYFLLATASELGATWTEAENLRRLSTVAERVTLTEGDRLTFNLRAVSVPPR